MATAPFLHLHTLGGLELRRPDGTSAGDGAQPKPLALLAFLAVTSDRPIHRRDSLVGLFWPELDQAHARAALRKALHHLRDLDPRMIVTRGDEEVRVDLDLLWCDAREFRRLAAAGAHAEALALYAGDFLPGFHVAEAPEFERWIDRERHRLRRLAADGAVTLAESSRASGEPVEAVRWATRAVELSPLEERSNRLLIELLDGAGDRAAALAAYVEYCDRLRREMELTPGPEIARVAERLRRHSPAQRPAIRPGLFIRRGLAWIIVALGAVWGDGLPPSALGSGTVAAVAVLPLAVAGNDPAAAYLTDGLADAVLTTMAHVPELRVIAPASSFRLRGATNAMTVGRQLGVEAVVQVGVERCAGRICVTARLIETHSGRTRWSRRYTRPVGDLMALLEEISLTLAGELRVRLASHRPTRYTESVRAYDRLLQGVYAHRKMTEQDLWIALQFYREAYEEDSSFGLAHALTAMAYIHLESYVPQEIAIPNARRHAWRAVELDTLLAEGHAAVAAIQLWYDWDFVGAERALRRAIMLYPSLPQAHSLYGWYLLQVRGKTAEAVASIRRALELDPLNAARSHTLETVLYLARRYDEVLEQHRTTLALGPAFAPEGHEWALYGAYREKGMYAEALAGYERVRRGNGGVPPAGLAITFARMGRIGDARQILGELRRRAGHGQRVPPEEIGRIYAALGDIDSAFAWLERAYRAHSGGLTMLPAEPAYDSLRSDPRFRNLMGRLGLSAPAHQPAT